MVGRPIDGLLGMVVEKCLLERIKQYEGKYNFSNLGREKLLVFKLRGKCIIL